MQPKHKFDYIKNRDSWGIDHTISIAYVLFNIDIAVYILDNEGNHTPYNIFYQNELHENRELCILKYHNNNHFDLLYSNEGLNNNISLANSYKEIMVKDKIKITDIKLERVKFNNEYIETNTPNTNIL